METRRIAAVNRKHSFIDPSSRDEGDNEDCHIPSVVACPRSQMALQNVWQTMTLGIKNRVTKIGKGPLELLAQ